MSHYYDYFGNKRHTYIDATGKRVDTTPKHAWRRGYCPSVTTVTHSYPTQFLLTWKAKEITKIACRNPQNPNEGDEAYCDRILQIHHREQSRIMEFGTLVHEECEAVVEMFHNGIAVDDMEFSGDASAHANAFAKWYAENYQSLEGCLADFKTQSIATAFSTYDEYKMQLAAYADAIIDSDNLETLSMPVTEAVMVNRTWGYAGTIDYYWPSHWDDINDIQLVNIFISREEPVQIKAHRYRLGKNEKYLEQWRALLAAWQGKHGNVIESSKWVPEIKDISEMEVADANV